MSLACQSVRARRSRERETPVEVKFVTASDGVKLAAHVTGSGPPVYAIHGGPANDHTGFGDHLAPISSYAELCLLDQRGCGNSDDAPVATYTLDTLVKDIEDVRLGLGHQKIHALGHSFGGAVAIAYALRFPENLASLIIVDSLVRGWRDILSWPAGWRIWAGYGLESLKKRPNWEALQVKYEVANHDTIEEVRRLLRGVRYDPARVRPLIKSASRRMDAKPLIDAGVPVLGVYGKQDKRFLGGARYLRSIGARVKLIDRSGHQPYVEQPEQFHAILKDFILTAKH
jgi:pimeloyl-ACP methyl ester carboxylesterase